MDERQLIDSVNSFDSQFDFDLTDSTPVEKKKRTEDSIVAINSQAINIFLAPF